MFSSSFDGGVPDYLALGQPPSSGWHPQVAVLPQAVAPPLAAAQAAEIITPDMLTGKDAEYLVKMYAADGEKFSGQALTALMKTCGIQGNGEIAQKKHERIKFVIERLGTQSSESSCLILDETADQKLSSDLKAWIDKHEGSFLGVDNEAVADVKQLASNLESVRMDFFARVGEDLVKYRTPAMISADANIINEDLVLALRKFVFRKILTGKPRPAIVVEAPVPAAAAALAPGKGKASTASNHYLLHTPIKYQMHHAANALRVLVILYHLRSEEMRSEVALYTQGFGATIGNCVSFCWN